MVSIDAFLSPNVRLMRLVNTLMLNKPTILDEVRPWVVKRDMVHGNQRRHIPNPRTIHRCDQLPDGFHTLGIVQYFSVFFTEYLRKRTIDQFVHPVKLPWGAVEHLHIVFIVNIMARHNR